MKNSSQLIVKFKKHLVEETSNLRIHESPKSLTDVNNRT